MAEQASFQDLIQRVRAGDAQATTELVQRYESAIRLAVHVRLTDPGMRRVLDSMDICQSVLASFFLRAAAGQYDLESPEQLLKLLTTMARNKVIKQVQRHHAARRDTRRLAGQATDDDCFVAPAPEPSRVAASRELLENVRQRLSEAERRLADQRAQGCSWKEIAAQVGGEPNTLRMQLTRALDRVSEELGLER